MKVLVTGANGFVGGALWQRLNAMSDVQAVGSVRRGAALADRGAALVRVDGLSAQTDWSVAVAGAQAVVHAAALVHASGAGVKDALLEFRRVNVQGSLRLAQQAAAAGVRRFVFLSSVKVNGEITRPGLPFSEEDVPAPHDPYAVSKLEAEQGLHQLAADTGMELVIIRPPLVYGPGVKANFAALMHAVQCGWPLPLGAVHNQRSLLALDNLLDFSVTCLTHPRAANQTFLVSDGHDLSTAELVRGLAHAAEVSAHLLPVPLWVLQAGASLLGRREAAQRLCGNLQVDIAKARRLLGWVPPLAVDEGLRRAVAGVKHT